MVATRPFVRLLKQVERAEPDAIVGFSLPFLPDMLTSHWLSRSSPHERLEEALHLQMRLIQRFGNSGIASWDLRFVGTESLPGVAIGLLCRLSPMPQLPPGRFPDYCQDRAMFVQQVFADFGYELSPLTDEASLSRYLMPFRFQAVGEIRRYEGLLALEDAYTRYEVYVPYPWQWASQSRLRLFEALLQRQGDCMVSVCLEPTQLNPHEQRHLSHATSQRVEDLLTSSGARGTTVYNIYREYARSLQQPYLVRIGLAASSYQLLEQIAWRFRDELNAAQVVEPVGRALLNELHIAQSSGTGPVLDVPRNREEWDRATASLFYLTWVPWGQNEGMALPGTARLRYLMDDRSASMAFRLPVARYGDIPGIPVRSLDPTQRSPSATSTAPQSYTPPPTASAAASTLPLTMQVSHTSSAGTARNIRRPEDLIGMTLGTCQIEALLGQGGFGAVYRAKQAPLNRYVAVKVILAALSNTDLEKRRKMLLRFDREAQIIARLDHPHILTVHEYQPEPLPYLVMPYVVGGSLADERAASGSRPLPASGVAVILQQAASALDHAHQQHLIHRDIKPHNLLRHQDGRILLSDFGIAQFTDGDHPAFTATGEQSPYTRAYASPEQLQGVALDHRSDIYSLGVVVYEFLAGQGLYPGAIQVLEFPPSIKQKFGVPVPAAVEAVVMKALAKQPAQRYQSAGEMATAFRIALGQASS